MWTWCAFDAGWGLPQACPLGMIFTVALCLSWCRALQSVPAVKPQLYADNLKCVTASSAALDSAARFTNLYIRRVGQEAAPKKCVLLITSKKVGSDMKRWSVSDAGGKWSVKLDVRDLGGHLDATRRARAATLGCRVSGVLPKISSVAALSVGFLGKLRLLRDYAYSGCFAWWRRPLSSLKMPFVGCVLLSFALSGRRACILLIWVLFLVSWMGFLVVTQVSDAA